MQYGVADRYLGQRMMVRFGGEQSRSVFPRRYGLIYFQSDFGEGK